MPFSGTDNRPRPHENRKAEMPSLDELRSYGSTLLKDAGIEHFQQDALILLEACTGKNRTELFLNASSKVSKIEENRYLAYISRRQKREPVAYITGEQEFWSLSFRVSPSVLVPRPETEFLVDRVLALADKKNLEYGKILDLCCGSGIIATVLAKETNKNIIGADISRRALEVARDNVLRHGVVTQVSLVQMDLLAAFLPVNRFSLIVSNPPYVSSLDIRDNLDEDVVGFEPHLALDGGRLGMEVIHKIRNVLPSMLQDGGQVFMEIGADQGNYVRDAFNTSGADGSMFVGVDVLVDYAGRDRVLVARYRKQD